MGLQQSKENARLEELIVLLRENVNQLKALGPAVAAEMAAGTPPAPGTSQALLAALYQRRRLLMREQWALITRYGECCSMLLAPWGRLLAGAAARWSVL